MESLGRLGGYTAPYRNYGLKGMELGNWASAAIVHRRGPIPVPILFACFWPLAI